jgi:hypothetical protein
MGLPMKLDGQPVNLKLDKPTLCPNCRNPIEKYNILTTSDSKKVAICPMCKNEIPPKVIHPNNS